MDLLSLQHYGSHCKKYIRSPYHRDVNRNDYLWSVWDTSYTWDVAP